LERPQDIIYMKLLIENWRKYINELSLGAPTKDINYTAFVLDTQSHEAVASLAPEGWKVFAHHMTVIAPQEMKRRLAARWLGYEGCFSIDKIAQNERVMAARVNLDNLPIPMKIKGLPHVTIATNPAEGGKPVMSNEFFEEDFKPIEIIKVCGTIKEVSR